jgi:hypothetical protein
MTLTTDNILALIDSWGRARNIIGGATALQQLPKLISEVGELADKGIAKGSRAEIIDGIGDVIVVLAMIAGIEGLTIQECLLAAYNDIKDRKGILYNGVFVKETDPVYPRILQALGR